MKRISTFSLFTTLLLSAACTATLHAAAPAGPPPGPSNNANIDRGPPPRNSITLIGKILSFNRNPRAGDIEGLMLQSPDGGLAQINVPAELAESLKKLPLGESVEVAVFPDNGPPAPQGPPDGPRRGAGAPPPGGPQDNRPQGPNSPSNHPVFQFISLKDAHANEIHAPQHTPISIDSTLKALNYSPRGEINGLQLANNDFVHLNPQNANLNIAPNDKITVEGMALTLPDGSHIIDPQSINGQPTRMGPPPPNDNADGPGPGPDQNPGPGPRGQRGPGRGPRGGRGPGGPDDPNAGPPPIPPTP